MNFCDLHGKRVDLLKISFNGLEDMFEYSQKPEFYRYFEYKPHKTIEDTRKYLEKLIKITKGDSGHYWFIRLKKTGKIIGTFGVVNIDNNRNSAEIGYGLSPDYWGHGYFGESLSIVLNYLFFNLEFYRISAKTRFDNIPSFKALEKVGFKKEGVMRNFYLSANGKRYDAVLFSILRDEFLKNNR
ncbi:MAG: GNAT family N-acetyltransferase [Thermoplasmatales archaeon]|nr:MAG: GNAT family N-acetyltransferase [Thermoplasmatales archaeon]